MENTSCIQNAECSILYVLARKAILPIHKGGTKEHYLFCSHNWIH